MTETSQDEPASAAATLLKGAAALAGAAAGSGAIAGFPAVHVGRAEGAALSRHRREPVRRHRQEVLKDDPASRSNTSPSTTDDVTKRVITQPNSFDVLDTEYFSLKKIVPSGNILGMDAKKIKQFDKITPVFTKGERPAARRSATRAPRRRR